MRKGPAGTLEWPGWTQIAGFGYWLGPGNTNHRLGTTGWVLPLPHPVYPYPPWDPVPPCISPYTADATSLGPPDTAHMTVLEDP